MQNRLQQLLELKNLTPAKFAQIVGIERSAVSHFLAGRNNPSQKTIFKILEKFPDISSEWFIMGQGEIIKEPQPIAVNIIKKKPISVFDDDDTEENEYLEIENKLIIENEPKNEINNTEYTKNNKENIENENFLDNEKIDSIDNNNNQYINELDLDSQKTNYSENNHTEEIIKNNDNKTYNDDNNVNSNYTINNNNNNDNNNNNQKQSQSQKNSIERILILQNDGTFKEYLPEIKHS